MYVGVAYVCQTKYLTEFYEWIQENNVWKSNVEQQQQNTQETITIDPSTQSFDEGVNPSWATSPWSIFHGLCRDQSYDLLDER